MRFGQLVVSLLAVMLAGCGEAAPEGPLQVSVIGAPAKVVAIGTAEPSAAQRVLLTSVAQGLVAFDAAGQIEPGLAERWIVTDDGRSYIFRLRRAEWRPGQQVLAEQVARELRRMTRAGGSNRLSRFFSAVEEIDAVTDDIIAIRLRSPRPHFLALLAAPEMALIRRGAGTGPYRVQAETNRSLLLTPVLDPLLPDEPRGDYDVALNADRAAHALVRFTNNRAEAVLGGTLADLAVARAAGIPVAQLRFDPAVGLFGLAVKPRDGFLANADNRNALAMAINRDALVRAFAIPGWRPATALVPVRLELPADPAQPEWVTLPLAERQAIARARVDGWRAIAGDEPPTVTVALPPGPGMRLLFARLFVDLRAVGITLERANASSADLTLLDAVAPNDSATWYLTRVSCGAGLPCDEAAERALADSRTAATLVDRAALLQVVDEAFVAHMPFISLASPVRWSAVKPRLTGFRPNGRAVHPLHRLLPE